MPPQQGPSEDAGAKGELPIAVLPSAPGNVPPSYNQAMYNVVSDQTLDEAAQKASNNNDLQASSGSAFVDLPPKDEQLNADSASDELSLDEKGKKKKKKKKDPKDDPNYVPPVSVARLFSYATRFEVLLMCMGALAALVAGCSMPVMIILFGDLTNAFVQHDYNATELCEYEQFCCKDGELNFDSPLCPFEPEDFEDIYNDDETTFMEEITRFGAGVSIIGAINFLMGYIFVTALNYAAENQVHRIRILFLQSILRQEIGWYDTNQTGDFASKMAEDLNKIQEGIGEKIGMFLFFMCTFLASLINAFIHGWELTLVMLSAMPVLVIATGIIAKSQTALTEKEVSSYSTAGAMAEEVLSAVRTVVAFGGEKKEVDRYEKTLYFSRKANIMRGLLTAIGGGLMWFIIYASYALAFWYGVKLIMDDREDCVNDPANCNIRYDPASLLIVFFSVLMGAMNVGQATPYVEAFSIARGAAGKVYQIIERKPVIDSSSKEGRQPKSGGGNITFKDVFFNYPSRKDVKILQGLNLSVSRGETVALVGPSGCGKSTVIQLIQRFYDPDQGHVEFEGDNITELNLGALRDKIGIVGQEPVLFDCTIAENIQMGRDNVTQAEMEAACKEANAYNFIMKLPKKFETLVGERGAQLSGGQKQRIAIARALVRNPEVLLLDEATSALDTQSEAVVQAALDKASSGRTTIVVAHRLSTIRQADKIVAIKEGQVFEIGTHDELMKSKGLYFSLVTAQMNDDEGMIESNEPNDDEVMDQPRALRSQMSTTSQKKRPLERGISVVSSAASEDGSLVAIEEASMAVGSAIGFGRDTLRGSTRRKAKNNLRLFNADVSSPEEEGLPKVDTWRIVKMNGPEWPYMVVGAIASIIMGASLPVYAILFGEVMGTLSEDLMNAREDSEFYALLFLGIGSIVGIAMFLQIFMFSVAGAHLTLRMRKMAYEAMLKQEMGWFDDAKNSTGALCSRLSADAAAIQGMGGSRISTIVNAVFSIFFAVTIAIAHQWKLGLVGSSFVPLVWIASLCQAKIWASHGAVETAGLARGITATGTRLGTILQSVFTIVISIALAMYYQWKLGLVTAAFIPFVLVAMYLQTKILMGQDTVEKKALEQSSKIAVEAISNIRTVAGLRREELFVEKYMNELMGPHLKAKKKSHLRGAVFGFAQSVPFFAYAACMYYGGYLVDNEGLEYEKVFKVGEALILGTMMVGQATAFAPNYNQAVIAAARIFHLLDRKPLIDSTGESGLRVNNITGNIEFAKAEFRYPSRKQVKVLRELSLSVHSGQTVALVGPSGCGKSTCIQLLQRFYNMEGGKLNLEGKDIESLNVPLVRSHIGIVSQEPTLFDRSLADNIAYGDNNRDVSMDEIIDAAKKANIHNFIASLPQECGRD